MLREYRAIRMQGGQETTGRPLALIRLTNAGSCPSRQRDCVAEPIRLANAAAPLLLRSQARRKAYRARSAETQGTAQLVLRTQARRKEKGLVKIPRIFLAPPHPTALAPTILRLHSLRSPICARTAQPMLSRCEIIKGKNSLGSFTDI